MWSPATLVSVFLQSHGYGCAPFTRHGPGAGAADRVPVQASKAWWSDLGKPISREVSPRSSPISRVAWPDRCAPLFPTTLVARRRSDSMPLLARRSDGANRPSAAWKPRGRPLPACARWAADSACPFPASRECVFVMIAHVIADPPTQMLLVSSAIRGPGSRAGNCPPTVPPHPSARASVGSFAWASDPLPARNR